MQISMISHTNCLVLLTSLILLDWCVCIGITDLLNLTLQITLFTNGRIWGRTFPQMMQNMYFGCWFPYVLECFPNTEYWRCVVDNHTALMCACTVSSWLMFSAIADRLTCWRMQMLHCASMTSNDLVGVQRSIYLGPPVHCGPQTDQYKNLLQPVVSLNPHITRTCWQPSHAQMKLVWALAWFSSHHVIAGIHDQNWWTLLRCWTRSISHRSLQPSHR